MNSSYVPTELLSQHLQCCFHILTIHHVHKLVLIEWIWVSDYDNDKNNNAIQYCMVIVLNNGMEFLF